LLRRPSQNAAPKETAITPPAAGKSRQGNAIALLEATTFFLTLDFPDSF